MTIDDIKALIAADESRTLELKKTTGELKDGMHSACAFLNTDGGWLIFGIAPKSLKILGQELQTGLKILGQPVTETTKREHPGASVSDVCVGAHYGRQCDTNGSVTIRATHRCQSYP